MYTESAVCNSSTQSAKQKWLAQSYVATYKPAWAIEEHAVLSTQTHKQQKVRDSSLAVYL